MKNLFTAVLFSSIIILLSVGCASTQRGSVKEPVQEQDIQQALKGKKAMKTTLVYRKPYEYCFKLDSGKKLVYSFNAKGPLYYNIHYHEGDKKLMPVKKKDVSTDSRTFYPESKANYCLQWYNLASAPVDLAFKFRVMDR